MKKKEPLTPHEISTVAQVKALLKQWPKGLALEFDSLDGQLVIWKRIKTPEGHYAIEEAAKFRKPSMCI